MKLTAFTQIIVTLAVTAWVFILPVSGSHDSCFGAGAAVIH